MDRRSLTPNSFSQLSALKHRVERSSNERHKAADSDLVHSIGNGGNDLQTPVRLNGSGGKALLQSLTKSPLNLNNTSNTSLNSTNSSANLSVPRNASNDFDTWGTKPKNPPMPGAQTREDYLNDSIISDM